MALACIGTPLTPSSSLIAKKTIFTYILELLNKGAPSVESYFDTNDSPARKKRTCKRTQHTRDDKLNSRQPITETLADKTVVAIPFPETPTPECSPTQYPPSPPLPAPAAEAMEDQTQHHHAWLQAVLDHCECPDFVKASNSPLAPIFTDCMPTDVRGALLVDFSDGHRLFLGPNPDGTLYCSCKLQTPGPLVAMLKLHNFPYPFIPSS